ncbi:SLC13 family permease [Candidatus Magnetominusculus xianensis]|uniref:Transporter n=1 Tax=Candidatus Magnetominusculus xianensis TaxID=1748249 RepID=A0ABR5SC38_9BACT|nr:SLC13 family permease [Candidatus Magnetominusculus xianensis]KWT78990.1 transporter [Candidatus Magnetominusculus xianensis]MBF0405003.1 SLC13/DASS family transporter [Nitrospirota bacterium]
MAQKIMNAPSGKSSQTLEVSMPKTRVDWRRISYILLGLIVFLAVYYLPAFSDAVDPSGVRFPLTREGKGAVAVFLLAVIWWFFEVLPAGVTGLILGSFQVLFSIRDADSVFSDYMDPAVVFIFGSIVLGMVFAGTGLTRRIAYKILSIIGENTLVIYGGTFFVMALLSHIMSNTSSAAAIFPLIWAIYSIYRREDVPTRFGKGLFMGMAFSAGAGSLFSMFSAPRAVVSAAIFKEVVNRDISFAGYSKYMFLIGWLVIIFIWIFSVVFFKPNRQSLSGLNDKFKELYTELGPLSKKEVLTIFVTTAVVCLLIGAAALGKVDNAAVVLISTALIFIFKLMELKHLEDVPWNIVLFFGGAMSMGYCLWETGASAWIAVKCLGIFTKLHWFAFLMVLSAVVFVVSNVLPNAAAVVLVLPVGLVMSKYAGVTPEVVFFSISVMSAMPFLLIKSSASNAIAFESRQFTAAEFFTKGLFMSVILLAILAAAILIIWPALGMPVIIRPD